MNTDSEKKALRRTARERRAQLAAAMPDHPARLAAYAASLSLPPHPVVGGYMALAGEADPILLLNRLRERHCTLALPRVVGTDVALAFHAWEPEGALAPGAYGVREPDSDWPLAVPAIVLVPLLAFDRTGFRLGYGGGYYDRTLAQLRDQAPVLAIGVGYAGQEVAAVPTDGHDQRLDMMLTENGFTAFAGL